MLPFVQYLYSRLTTKGSVNFHCVILEQDTDYYLLGVDVCAELAWFLYSICKHVWCQFSGSSIWFLGHH